MKLSQRVQNIKPSATNAITDYARELRAQGQDLISLSTGEPDFDTPEHIKAAAISALERGETKYTAVDGSNEIKDAVIAKLKRDNQLSYQRTQIIVSTGAKQTIFNLCQALLNSGDEVIIPAPYWVSYPDITRLAEATPVILPTTLEQQFKITPTQLEATITPQTRLLMINSPSNPSGQAYSKAELEALGAVLKKYPNVLIATDDIYEDILWTDEPFTNIVMSCPELYARTIVINGASKIYAMTGWRIGYAAGPEPLIKAMKKIQSQSTSCPNSIAQAAMIAALNGPQDCVREMTQAFKTRHDHVLARLQKIPDIDVIPSDGTFYTFPCFDRVIAKLGLADDSALATYLLESAKVALVPGSAFGTPGFLRFSYATDIDTLNKAIDRIEQAITQKPVKSA